MDTPLRVLIVEDSADDAKLMVRALRRHGFVPQIERVETADAMTAALDRQPWDAILADYSLPHFSAPLALQLVQARNLDLPFIVVSGTVGEEKAAAMMKAGAHDFLLKDSLVRLGAAVHRELRDASVRCERRRAENALRLLAETSSLLASASDYRAILRGAADLVVPAMADWCILYASGTHTVLDMVETAHVAGVNGEALATLARQSRPPYPPAPSAEDPTARALRTQQPILMSTLTEASIAQMAREGSHRAALRAMRPGSMVILPLLARGHLLGLWLLASTSPGYYTETEVNLITDISGRVSLVAENARLSRARDEFIATAIHEIKTPVAVMKLAVQRMQANLAAAKELNLPRYLVRLDRQCDRITRLVTNVLDVSRVELTGVPLTRRDVDMAALVDRVIAEVDDASPSHQLSITRNDPVTAHIDVDRIEQVLYNLLDNAIKYSPPGRVEVASRRDGHEVVVSVHDEGIGIPADKQERVFELFHRAHVGTPYDFATSMGVSLYLSREFVTRHRGHIWFESEPGAGATFYFSLPLATDAASALNNREASQTHPRGPEQSG